MERVRAVRFFDEAGGGASPDRTGRASGAPGANVSFDAGRSYRRRLSSYLWSAADRGTLLGQLE